jgi:hypothetical protein
MSTDPDNLPAARLVPKDRADQIAILRGQASDGARKAGRAAVSITKGLSLLALCGAGIAAIGAVGPSRSRRFDDIDRQMKSLRQLNLQPIPKFDSLELERIRTQLYRDLQTPNGAAYRRYQFQQLELIGEPLHQESRF